MKLWTGIVIFALAGDIMMMAEHDPYDWWIDDPHAEPLTTLVFLDVEKPERDTVDPKYRVEVPDNHSLWRHDRKCGFYGRTLYLLSDNITVAQCDPDGSYPCCTRWGRCGSTSWHCDCNGCIDYRVSIFSYLFIHIQNSPLALFPESITLL
ncbi:uncharacterized protein LOC136039188 [Artemia franciscana]|uniref:uncharacterized protein LOC136039188 n=1 Tax=Artemia franciscana TaxID=6661 RepID=UPI0032DA1CA6